MRVIEAVAPDQVVRRRRQAQRRQVHIDALRSSGPLGLRNIQPKDLTEVYKRGFEQRNPGVRVEVMNRGTSAGVTPPYQMACG